MFQTDDVAVMSSDMFIGSVSLVILEVNGYGDEDLMDVLSVEGLMGVFGVEILMGVVFSLDYPLFSFSDV